MNSKANFFFGLVCTCMLMLSFDLSAQAPTRDPKNPPTPTTATPTGTGTSKTNPSSQTEAKKATTPTQTGKQVDATALNGEYMSNASCVDMNVRKGCVTYSITPVEGAAMAKTTAGAKMRSQAQKSVKVCATSDEKPTRICPEGSTKFKVRYQRADKAAVVDFSAQPSK